MNWREWLIGLVNAVLSALTSGSVAAFVGVGWKRALAIAGASAFVSFGKWIVQHPLPGAGEGSPSNPPSPPKPPIPPTPPPTLPVVTH